MLASSDFLFPWFLRFLNLFFSLAFFAVLVAGFAFIMAKLIKFIYHEGQQYGPNKYMQLFKTFLPDILSFLLPRPKDIQVDVKIKNLENQLEEIQTDLRKTNDNIVNATSHLNSVFDILDKNKKSPIESKNEENISINEEKTPEESSFSSPTSGTPECSSPRDGKSCKKADILNVLVKNAIDLSSLTKEEKDKLTIAITTSILNHEFINNINTKELNSIIDRISFNVFSIIKTEIDKQPELKELMKSHVPCLQYTNWFSQFNSCLPENVESLVAQLPIKAIRDFLQKYYLDVPFNSSTATTTTTTTTTT